MKIPSLTEMLDATRLTRAGRLSEATESLQRLLHGEPLPAGVTPGSAPHLPRVREPLAGLSALLRPQDDAPAETALPGGGQFLARVFRSADGSRPYKLFVPSGYAGQAVPLIVMLHGCTQSPDDFAAGTRMNVFADEGNFLVAYPGQTSSANSQKCWNWFNADDQRRGHGEPALIAGITREVMAEYAVDPRRVYIAGLSAGGATAAIMGATYPDLYAAIGVHSELACGAARDLPSAFAAMRQGKPGNPEGAGVPVIVFHGDSDTTVHPSNADAVLAQAMPAGALATNVEEGRVPGGHGWRRAVHRDASGNTVLEQWTIRGAGHAWSGGSRAGSFTDPKGPDATREMLRFFLAHPAKKGVVS